MKKPSTAFLAIALVILALTALLLIQRNQTTPTALTAPTDQQTTTGQPHPSLDHPDTARGQNGPAKPQSVSMATGNPTPGVAFPRGTNQRRRYAEPVTRKLPEELRNQPPAILAMIPADGRTELLESEIDTHTLHSRRLVLNTAAIDQVINGETSHLIAPTPNGDQLDLEIESVKTRSARTHTLIGRVAGEGQASDVQIVYHDGIIHGTVALYNTAQHIEYRILPDGHMMVRDLDHSTMTATCAKAEGCSHDSHSTQEATEHLQEELAPEGISIETTIETPQPDTADAAADTSGWTTVDILIGYGKQARIADGGVTQIEARIISAVDRMNTSFSNSLINDTELMLLGTIEDPDYNYPGSFDGSMGEELDNLDDSNDGPLDTVTDYASQLGADYVSFFIKAPDGGAAGIAYLTGKSSIVARDYVTTNRLTFCHEVGHNFGCDHSWGDSSQSYHKRYGWRIDPPENPSTTDRVRTIMAYDWNWGTGQRIPYFANPNVLYQGARTGATPGYDVRNDATADQRYAVGGLGYSGYNPTLSGFDGSHANLAAMNADNILNGTGSYGAVRASLRSTRTPLDVTTPIAASTWNTGQVLSVFFTGGDYEYTANIDLYKGADLVANIATEVSAIERDYSWLIPSTTALGDDYMVRVTLTHPTNGEVFADSGFFSISEAPPRITTHTPDPSPSPSTLSNITLFFSEVMDTDSFSIEDDILSFTGPYGQDMSGQIAGFTWGNNDTELSIIINSQSAAGFYRMVISPEILDLSGNPLDQDQDETTGEPLEDSYIAIAGLNGAGPGLIWNDMIGEDAPDAGWRFPVGGSWAKGYPAETPPNGPDASADGGQIVATNLSGNYRLDERSHAESPAIDCSQSTDVTLKFKSWTGASVNDMLYVDVWDGSLWQRIYEFIGFNSSDNSENWSSFTQSIAAYADGNSALKIRWGVLDASIGRQSTQSTGWQIDAVELLGTTPTEPMPSPIVLSYSPNDPTAVSYSSIWLDFTNPMDALSFTLDSIAFNGPLGDITPTEHSWISPSVLRIDFPEQTAMGSYSMTLASSITDIAGNMLDTDEDGTGGEIGEDEYVLSFVIGNFQEFYDIWAAGTFTNLFTDIDPLSNPEGDRLINLLEYAFGTDPTVISNTPLSYVADGDVTGYGLPIVVNFGTANSPDFRAVFVRRKNYQEAGVGYITQFSATLANWVIDSTPPTRLTSETSSGDYDAVAIPFPATIDEGSGDVQPQFFRLVITGN